MSGVQLESGVDVKGLDNVRGSVLMCMEILRGIAWEEKKKNEGRKEEIEIMSEKRKALVE